MTPDANSLLHLGGTGSPAEYSGDVATITPIRPRPAVLEFFAGMGLARIGLESVGFEVVWANDYEADKFALYEGHFGHADEHTFVVGDIAQVNASDLPRGAAVAWASSPCTDLSLAGNRLGLSGRESAAFWPWVALLEQMGGESPEVVVLENVIGLSTSRNGEDLRTAIRELNRVGYSIDLLSLDARRFLPQSRPRLFLVGAKNPPAGDSAGWDFALRPKWTRTFYDDANLRMHRANISTPPPLLESGFGELVEDMAADDPRWWNSDKVDEFVRSMSAVQLERLEGLCSKDSFSFRTAYRRTRKGRPVWEVRADDISGCLRTARGGSSKQAVVRAGHGDLRVRWMTPLEYARLMGAGDYNLEGARNSQAQFAFGDAVAVPVVRWLAKEYLVPLLQQSCGNDSSEGLRSVV